MGLSIHYSGRFNSSACLRDMVDEITDIVNTFRWPFEVYRSEFPTLNFSEEHDENFYGMSFTPPGCETVFLCFLSNGRMTSPLSVQFFKHSQDPEERQLMYYLSVKTQYAGIDVHRTIIRLFRHIRQNYLTEFEMVDEGKFWETNDEAVLKDMFERYDSIINELRNAFENSTMVEGETAEEYVERIMRTKLKHPGSAGNGFEINVKRVG